MNHDVNNPTPDWDLAAFRAAMQSELDAFVDLQSTRLLALGDDAAQLVGAARASVSGGKRFRAAFCHWGFHAVRPPADASEERALVRAAAALEILHASALVHDDVMDASDTRRGHPSTHRAFERLHREAGWRGNPEQYGLAAAILLGDLLLSWADELLRTCGFGPDAALRALEFFDTTRSEVIAGQFLDVSVQARGAGDVEQAMRVLRYKSAKYSVERPLHIGAALAGGSADQIATLTSYGLPLGEAFQLRDDLLGAFGDPVLTGKPAGDDLVEGKRTVLVALALGGLGPEDAERLDRGLGTPLSPEEVVGLCALLRESGAEAEVERRITTLLEESLAALEGPVTPASRTVLTQLATAATQRTV